MDRKRARSSSPPTSPYSSPKRRRFSSSCSYPYLPLSPSSKPYPTRPSDSPSNPFGRKRTIEVKSTLPPETSFGKHIPLRFQCLLPGRRPEDDDIYRIVQVPLNYTFTHLKALIFFLFGGKSSDPNRSADLSLSEREGHLFEVYKDIERCPDDVNPGLIRRGRLWLTLSSQKDPYLYRREWEVEEPTEDEEPGKDTRDPPPTGNETHWEAEEDTSLGIVWNYSRSLSRGIIYYHYEGLSESPIHIHITHASKGASARRGRGNVPFVFSARGCADLLLEEDYRSSSRRMRGVNLPLDVDDEIAPDRWNIPEDSFSQYFEHLHALRQLDMGDEDDDSDFGSSPTRSSSRHSFTSTPGLTTSSTYPGSSSPVSVHRLLAPSSPDACRIATSLSSPIAAGLSIDEQYEPPACTPAPGPVNAKRLGYFSRRYHRSTHRFMKWMIQQEGAEPLEGEKEDADKEDGRDGDVLKQPIKAVHSPSPIKKSRGRSPPKLNVKEAALNEVLVKRVGLISTGIFTGTTQLPKPTLPAPSKTG